MQVCDNVHMPLSSQLCLEFKLSLNKTAMRLLNLISTILASEVNEDCISSEIGVDCHHACDLQFKLGFNHRLT